MSLNFKILIDKSNNLKVPCKTVITNISFFFTILTYKSFTKQLVPKFLEYEYFLLNYLKIVL